jgi:hypothetical protein
MRSMHLKTDFTKAPTFYSQVGKPTKITSLHLGVK